MRLAWKELLLVCPLLCGAVPRSEYNPEARRWTLRSEVLEASFQLGMAGTFEFGHLSHLSAGGLWRAAEVGLGSPIRIDLGGAAINENSMFRLVSHWTSQAPRGGLRQNIVLEEVGGLGEVWLEFDIYSNLPTLRQGVRYRNTTGRSVTVTAVEPVRWNFDDAGQTFRALRVEQWLPSLGANPADFERINSAIDANGRVLQVASGAQARHCSWLTLADTNNRGIALGWEFNGRMTVDVRHWSEQRRIELTSRIPALNHAVDPGEEFQIPRSFISLYSGGADDAAYMTHRFVEEVLAVPVPVGLPFPLVSWDSWGYGAAIDERVLWENTDKAARLGVELFVVDLGWASAIGDWHADPLKFPRGLRALSDHVHSLGMKFGVHFAFAEASPASRVMQANPTWRASSNDVYYGATSLCLSHKPVREWIVAEAIRMIDDYQVDWILQDGENIVPECTRADHTHDPRDSNYANAIDGLEWVLDRIQQQRPHVLWENCENGGNMMTFQMVQRYVTSIVNDASGARAARLSAYGAMFPFPSRYSDRYMPEERMDSYTARSYLFGGPWVLMNKLASMGADDVRYLGTEIARFKSIRNTIRAGKVLHLTNPPAEGRTDAMAAYDPATDSAVAVVTRDGSPSATYTLRIGEFDSAKSYAVSFADDTRILTFTGARLGQNGVSVRLPEPRSAEVVYITPLN